MSSNNRKSMFVRRNAASAPTQNQQPTFVEKNELKLPEYLAKHQNNNFEDDWQEILEQKHFNKEHPELVQNGSFIGYLVAYEERHVAKALGCKWDTKKRTWYTSDKNPNLMKITKLWSVDRDYYYQTDNDVYIENLINLKNGIEKEERDRFNLALEESCTRGALILKKRYDLDRLENKLKREQEEEEDKKETIRIRNKREEKEYVLKRGLRGELCKLFNVPFKDKDKAKELRMYWNPVHKKWSTGMKNSNLSTIESTWTEYIIDPLKEKTCPKCMDDYKNIENAKIVQMQCCRKCLCLHCYNTVENQNKCTFCNKIIDY